MDGYLHCSSSGQNVISLIVGSAASNELHRYVPLLGIFRHQPFRLEMRETPRLIFHLKFLHDESFLLPQLFVFGLQRASLKALTYEFNSDWLVDAFSWSLVDPNLDLRVRTLVENIKYDDACVLNSRFHLIYIIY